jgi:hypothetical protein
MFQIQEPACIVIGVVCREKLTDGSIYLLIISKPHLIEPSGCLPFSVRNSI